VSAQASAWHNRAGHVLLHAVKHLLPPMLYFFCAFNLIVFTTNLLTHSYWFALSNFLTASGLALIVGKSVLVADKLHTVERFRGAPLIQPILYKTLFYGVAVMIVRTAELLIEFAFAAEGFAAAFHQAAVAFTWHHFAAVQIWLFVCFLIYVTANELSAALGPGKLKRLVFGPRSD
jgi:hypothetical protein